jgi:hypothetical protein
MGKSGEIAASYNEFLLRLRQERRRVAWLDYGDCRGAVTEEERCEGTGPVFTRICKLQLSGNQSRQKGRETSVSVQDRLCGSAG